MVFFISWIVLSLFFILFVFQDEIKKWWKDLHHKSYERCSYDEYSIIDDWKPNPSKINWNEYLKELKKKKLYKNSKTQYLKLV